MKTTLHFIRHAETVWNREQRIQGFLDSPLTPEGEEQARRLNRRMRHENLAACYSSDLKRSLETARLALEGTSLSVQVLDGLRERNLGIWEGRNWEDIKKTDQIGPKEYRTNAAFTPEGGESFLDLMARVQRVIDLFKERHDGKTIAAFTSGGTIKAAIAAISGAPTDRWSLWGTWNTSVTSFEWHKGYWRILQINDVSHLRSY